ncbi:MAG: DUF1800 domain-containing protein [Thiobacillaceae bacterium]
MMIRTPRALTLLVLLGTFGFAANAQPFDFQRKMDEASARAMLGRFGYGADKSSLEQAMKESPRDYLMRAIQGNSNLPQSIEAQIGSLPIAEPVEAIWAKWGPGGVERVDRLDPEAQKEMQRKEREFVNAAVQARLLTMANSDNPGHEALLSFWLNHFSIFGPKSFDKLLSWDYAKTIERAMAEDSFEALLRASFYHPAMQIYLDNAQSTAPSSPAAFQAELRGKQLGINENLARELMELHTLGVNGGYTQKDVQELARIITGAGVYVPRMRARALEQAGATRIGLFLFDPRRHDRGEKNFLQVDFPADHGMDEIDRALHLLATSPATAQRIAFKLAVRFLSDDPPKELVDAMAEGYLRSGGKISATLLPLIRARAFAESLSAPIKFKEPLDYMLSASRVACSGTPIGNRLLLMAVALDMGQAPFMHTTPDGYGMREADWLSPAAMAKRVRIAMGIAASKLPLANGVPQETPWAPRQPQADKPQWLQGTSCEPDLATITQLVGPVSMTTRAALEGLSDGERIGLLLAGPEFMRR